MTKLIKFMLIGIIYIFMPLSIATGQTQKTYQLVTKEGKPLTEELDYISWCLLNRVIVTIDGKSMVTDSLGNVLFPRVYKDIKSILYESSDPEIPNQLYYFLYNDERKCALMNGRFEIKTPFLYKDYRPLAYGRIAVKKDGYWGLIDTLGHELIPFFYEDYNTLSLDRIAAQKTGYWVIIDTLGNRLTHFLYENCKTLSLDRIAAKKDGYWGMIDTSGNELTPFIYDDRSTYPGSYKEEFWNVEKDGQTGIVYKNGKQVIPLSSDQYSFSYPSKLFDRENHSLVLPKNEKVGVIDTTGRVIVPFIYTFIDTINSANLAKIVMQDGNNEYHDDYIIFGKKGVIDKNGKAILPLDFYRELVTSDKGIITLKDDVYSYYDTSGNLKFTSANKINWTEYACFSLRYETETADRFYDCDGHQVHRIEKREDEDPTFYWRPYKDAKTGLLGFSDFVTGEVYIPARYEEYEYKGFDGLWLLAAKLNGKWGVVDSVNNVLVPFEYTQIGKLYGARRLLLKKGRKMALADYSGKILTPFDYDDINGFYYKCQVALRKGNKIAIADRDGQPITPFRFDMVKDFDLNQDDPPIYLVRVGKKCGVVDTLGNELVPCIYDSYRTRGVLFRIPFDRWYDDNMLQITKKDKSGDTMFGLLDWRTGREIVPCVNYRLECCSNRKFIRTYDRNGEGIYRPDGKEVLPCRYRSTDVLPNEAVIATNKDKKKGLFDTDGNEILPMVYEEIKIHHGDVLLVIKETKTD